MNPELYSLTTPKDYETIRKLIGAYEYLVALVGDKDTSLRRLRQMLFGAKTEKTAAVIGGLKGVEKASPEAAVVDSPAAGEGEACAKVNAETTAETSGESHSPASDEASPEPSGHGHNGADAYTSAMIALLKYGNGMPFNRGEHLQENLGIPLPASTQWDIVEAQAERAEPVFVQLVQEAAQGDVVYNDDTGVKILEMMGERSRQAALAEGT
jgi:hypothetical protein